MSSYQPSERTPLTLNNNIHDAAPSTAAPRGAGADVGYDEPNPSEYLKHLVEDYDPSEPLSPASPQTRSSSWARVAGACLVVAALGAVIVATWASLPAAPPPSQPARCRPVQTRAVMDAVARLVGSDAAARVSICVLASAADIARLQAVASVGMPPGPGGDSGSGARNSSSAFQAVAPAGGLDAFSVAVDAAGRITIDATTGSAAGSGFYYVAKNYYGVLVTWGVNGTGNQIETFAAEFRHATIDGPVRAPLATVYVRATVPIRWSWNMCTFGYSGLFWSGFAADGEQQQQNPRGSSPQYTSSSVGRWEKELDWLLMHGINVPLALMGQEYVWVRMFADDYGVGLDELQSWFTGPAFLAWQRAGNIRRFAGPLPMAWIEDQHRLQVRVLRRMRDFGMMPVLPCFGGHVPDVARRLFPNATMQRSPRWNTFSPNMSAVYMIDPVDPAFKEIGVRFMRKLKEVYGFGDGDRNYFSCDTFNENNPTSTDPTYLRAAAASVVDSIRAVDASGVWVLQAWLFSPMFHFWSVTSRVEAYLSGAPIGKLLVLDLHSEDGVLAWSFDSYYGHAFVWCMLHNYGGRHGMYGNLAAAASGPFEALAHANSTMLGIGFTPESIEQNPNIYELLTETFHNVSQAVVGGAGDAGFGAGGAEGGGGGGGGGGPTRPVSLQYVPAATAHFNVTAWLDRYLGQRYAAARRAGRRGSQQPGVVVIPTADARSVFAPLLASEYAPTLWAAWSNLWSLYTQWCDPVTELERVPQLSVYGTLGYSKCGSPGATLSAFELAVAAVASVTELDARDHGIGSGPLMYDAVDIARQAAVMFFGDLHAVTLDIAWQHQTDPARFNATAFDAAATNMLEVILALDDLLATNPNWLFGHWMQRAVDAVPRSIVDASERRAVADLFWYNAKNIVTLWGPTGNINDYAMKPWSGLYRHYYHMRWNMSLAALRAASGGAFVNGTAHDAALLQAEIAWCARTDDRSLYATAAAPFTDVAHFTALMSRLRGLVALSDAELAAAFARAVAPAPAATYGIPIDNLATMWTSCPRQLAKLCLLVPACVGFSTQAELATGGMLYASFTTIPAPVSWIVYRRK